MIYIILIFSYLFIYFKKSMTSVYLFKHFNFISTDGGLFCKTRENFNFLKKGKMVISVKI